MIEHAITPWIVLVACGVSFVATCTVIAYPFRLIAFHTLGKLTVGPIHLDSVFRCPFCNAWWGALLLSFWAYLPWWQALANAFTACLAMGIAQAQWHLAADDGFDDKSENEHKDKSNNEFIYELKDEVMPKSDGETIRESQK